MTDSLAELEAKEEILGVLACYCRAFDRQDRAMLAACWHEGGPAQSLDRSVQRGQAQSCMIANALILVDGQTAVSESYATTWNQAAAVDGLVVERHWRGRYLDRWSRRNGRWAIDERRTICDCYSELEVPADQIPAELSQASRADGDDPSIPHLKNFRA